jgi:predicted nucleic acid-binding protein
MSPKRPSPLSHSQAVAWVQFWKRLPVHSICVPQVDLALEIAGRFGVNYYDALIISAARFAGCSIVYSEDLSDGQDYDGVIVKNPFATRR